jgi:hypothetical protein
VLSGNDGFCQLLPGCLGISLKKPNITKKFLAVRFIRSWPFLLCSSGPSRDRTGKVPKRLLFHESRLSLTIGCTSPGFVMDSQLTEKGLQWDEKGWDMKARRKSLTIYIPILRAASMNYDD